MKTIRNLLAAGCVLAVGTALWAQALPAERARRQQQVQQQVRTMARQLVGGVLDIQLQQLRENGLTSHPWYGEIKGMKEHLDEMIETQMPQVIAMLAKIDATPGVDQAKVFQEASEKSRQIVVRLLIERQVLLRRLKIAEIAAQAQQLIELQTKVLGTTQTLPEQPAARRQALNVAAVEDQRDIRAAYGQFKIVLADVSHWTGSLGQEAAAGLRLLGQHRVDEELGKAESHLTTAAFAEAATSQKVVIRGLQALLEEIRRAEKLARADAAELGNKIRDLIEKQQEARKDTAESKLDKPEEVDKLVAKETEVRKEIANLEEAAGERPDLGAKLDEAKKSAEEAAADLFDQKKPEAVARQDDVLKALGEAAKEADRPDRKQATKTAEQAIEKARAETAATLADARREQLTDKIEQLARDAAKLDQAAEAERQIAADANQGAKEQGLSAEQAKQLGQEQKDVSENVKSVAEDMKSAAPEAAQTAQEARQPMGEAQKQLDAAQQQPDEASKNPAAKAGEEANKAADQLAKAADQARSELGKTAQQLAQTGQKQLDQVEQARQNVEQALAQAVENSSTPDRLQQLLQAQEKVQEAEGQLGAAIDQLKAESQQQLAQEGERAGELAQQTAPLDPGATAALQSAENQGQQGSQSQQASGLQAAQAGVVQALGDAAGSLAEKGREIAGAMAQGAAMAQAAEPGQGQGMAQAGEPGQEQGPSTQSKPGPAGGMPNAGGVSNPGGAQGRNQAPPEQPLVSTTATPAAGSASADSAEDSKAGGRDLLDQPWFAKLPPELRAAIRNNAQRKPPRGYEERLQQYFENLD
ncbi:MAG: hypothetical protein ABR915_07330 [Thermoguttaceae bacterium]